ncbi:Na+-translocating decarboxylase subunit beta [Opitutaceae bacterium TAV4]|uniref:sodium ion-translocating decarboxylase subunit beta n=1 Tax=Geminisphaera colitermitum TaxID=1148786 RepID=UPI000158D2B2|nr:sodium ion-translocating decarboxylase subunit beta [Geminisphaera colitermitum]RRJ94353.1 Na+-translocating decarboxylase subunit beta [Opitutaceae bacterium TAV4]RRJ98443.1 Na+-translocating decarboxylase subunit beta [Opitutaceae bacterium TAV3]
MTFQNILDIFQGVTTLIESPTPILIARIGLIFLGMLLVYLGKKGTLEPLLMIPMGLAMCAVNAGVLFLDPTTAGHIVHGSAALADPVAQQQLADTAAAGQMHGTLFMSPLVEDPSRLMGLMQIDFLQPIFNFAFSNNLIACLVFMGIGVLLDVGFVLARPFLSITMALFCELGTIVTFPIAVAMGFTYGEAASIALVGGADGPMVLFASLSLAKDLLVPITVIAYLYLGLVYGGYPYLIRALIPAKLRGLRMPARPITKITSGEKLAFAVVACTVLCLLFPSAAPLFFSLFLGVAVREAGLKVFSSMIENVLLYGATMFLGLLLGILCEAATILNPKVILLLILGILALLLSGVGGIIGGYCAYFFSGRKINPVIGIAGVSCVPTTAKVAQKEVSHVTPDVIVLPEALGANISGVITTAILTGIYVTLVPLLSQ